MNVSEFLELCGGNWFSQRTSYHLQEGKEENSKAEITIEILSQEHPELIQICQQAQIDPQVTLGGKKASWDNSVDWGQTKQVGSTTIVLIPDLDNQQTGQLLHRNSNPPLNLNRGRYVLGNDQALTLIVEQDGIYWQERLWFASPNLRLRTSLIKYPGDLNVTSFYSEIRKMAAKKDNS